MQLFVDVDGVLLDFEQSFVLWLNQAYGLGLPADYQAQDWDFSELMSAEELDRRWRLYLASPASAEMPPLIEPQRFNRLGESHSVHLVTNFPLPHWEKRVRNLQALGFAYHSLHHCGFLVYDGARPKSKAQIVAELREQPQPALFVDDHPENCVDVLRNCDGVEVWLMTRRFNRDFHHPQVNRAQSWESLLARLEG